MQDSAYAELFSHRATYSGTAPVGEWPALPFADILQAVGNSHCHVVSTGDGLWGSAGLHNWARLETLAAGSTLLEGLAVVASDGRVSALDCAGNATLIATLDTACAQSVTSGQYDAGSGALVVGYASGVFLGTASATKPPSLAREPSVDGGVIASATWAGYVAAATTQRLHWRRPSGEWWWEWISLAHGDGSTCDGDYDGGAVEGAPVALAFDAGYGSDGGLWIGHSFGLQVLDLTHGALQRFGVYDGPTGLPVANVTSLAVGVAELWVGTARGLARRAAPHARAHGRRASPRRRALARRDAPPAG